MFGYVTINPPELKMKEYHRYKAYYCGLCKALKKRHGIRGQVLLNYDMTFLVILLTGLYECKTRVGKKRCFAHPLQLHPMLMNEMSAYAADMNVLMAYYHFMDDWRDARSIPKWAAAKLLERKRKKIEKQYKRQGKTIANCIKQLTEYEKQGERNLDKVAGCFGELLSEVFIYQEDCWQPFLKRIGFFLGKFIYLMDAYEDLQEDQQKGTYNPFLHYYTMPEFEALAQNILNMMMAECSMAFEKLPIVKDVEILRNILYSGVWVKYGKLKLDKGKTEKSGNKDRR